jgi:predicted DNA-binding ArsR family transcriptional regulator
VVRDAQDKPYTVRYDAVNAMLLNEFLKEHRKVEELEKASVDERREIAELKQLIKAQAAAIQQVNDELELRTVAPRVVNNR